jgi:hypothetical protein
VFYMDIVGPLILIALLIYTGLYKSRGKHEREPADTEQPTGQPR